MVAPDRLTDLAASIAARAAPVDGPALVALSGGADSAALLWHLVSSETPCRAVHVIHGLEASAMMSTAAGQIAARLGVGLTMVPVRPASTSEADLRDARHAALARERAGDEVIVLGHSADDQAETVLLRLIRGTGPDGLAAMSVRHGHVMRPFLEISRAETRELARLAGLPFRDDPANDDPAVLRNRVRSELVPLLDDLSGGHAVRRLVRLASIARSESPPVPLTAVEWTDGAARVPLGVMATTRHPGRIVREIVRRLDPPYAPDAAAIERVLSVARGDAAGAEIRSGLDAWVEGVHLHVGGPEPPVTTWEAIEIAEGTVSVPRWTITVRHVPGPIPTPRSDRVLAIPSTERAVVRPISDDDRVSGRRGADALADARVPARRRPGWPVVDVGGEPVWVVGARRRVWSGASHPGYLVLTAREEPPWRTSAP